jgi:hypothetical protein
LLENATSISLKEAPYFIISMHDIASAELVEVLDRIIGGNVYELESNLLIPCFKAFAASGKAREKILIVLFNRIKSKLNHFTIDELC